MDRKSFCVKNGKRYKLVPPDGGWGYLICMAVSLNMVVSTCFIMCFGVLFKEFVDEHHVSSTSVTLLNGINCVCLSISGFVTGSLLKKTTFRKLGLFAALIYNLGSLGTIFVTSFTQLIVVQGLLQHIGIGIMINLGYTVLNEYFEKKRLFAFSFCKAVMGLSWMLAPMFVKWSLEEYGFRNTLVIIFGINMHLFVGVALMQPIEWHRIMIEDTSEEEYVKENVEPTNEIYLTTTVKLPELVIKINSNEENMQNGNANVELEKLITKKENLLEETKNDFEQSDSDEARGMVEYVKRLSVTNFPMDQIPVQIKKFSIRSIIASMDFKLFNDARFLITCICVCFAYFLDSNYGLLLPLALYDYGWDNYNVALALSLFALGDITFKLFFVVISKLMHFDYRKFYLIGLLIALLTRLGSLWVNDITGAMVLFCIMGTSRCFFHILTPILVADMVETKRFPSANGLVMLTYGFVNILFAPIVGAVRDWSQSYFVTFLALTGCFAFVTVLWTANLYFNRKRTNKIV